MVLKIFLNTYPHRSSAPATADKPSHHRVNLGVAFFSYYGVQILCLCLALCIGPVLHSFDETRDAAKFLWPITWIIISTPVWLAALAACGFAALS